MNLVAPTFLAALALLVPIVIAFLVRRQRQILRVPSTIVWRLSAQSIAKSHRIRDLRRLLALLACLFGVAALVIAAARPTGTSGETTAYVVDVSASMSGSPIADARAWLLREVAALGPNARVAIVAAGADARVALPPSPPGPLVDDAIRALGAERSGAALDEAVALAEALVQSGGGRARVVVLSDRAVDADVSRLDRKPTVRVFPRAGGGAVPSNVGITSLFTRTAPDARDDEEREASVVITTSSTTTRRVRLVVTLAGRTLADRRIEVTGRDHVERIALRGSGRLVARVEVADGVSDATALDDEASLDEVARRPPRVVLVKPTGDGAAGFFVEQAVRAAGVTDVAVVDPDAMAPFGADVVIALQDGPARPKDTPTFLLGVEPPELGLVPRPIGRTDAHLRSLANEDPVLRGVTLDELTTMRAKVAGAIPLGARTLIDLDAGPTMLVGGAGRQAWVWLGIDPEASDLVLRVAFPVLVGNVLAHLSGASQVVSAPTVPRAEVTFAAGEVPTPLPRAPDPRWRVPVRPSMLLATFGAFLLALEAWFTFRKRAQRA